MYVPCGPHRRGLRVAHKCSAAEHHVLYQYNLVNARQHYMGLIQTETVRVDLTDSERVTQPQALAIFPTGPLSAFALRE
jgi:hypothetical protein